jgi:hypothetical protein
VRKNHWTILLLTVEPSSPTISWWDEALFCCDRVRQLGEMTRRGGGGVGWGVRRGYPGGGSRRFLYWKWEGRDQR